ncbi:hypothetical protein SDC9_211208 [bioreactor metagenome]|uniref:Uncharacterized protein n=1 Tax=bioreactor metagenome TaxID=1076179 RepID=A0A645JL55_9ZZZZ
MKHALYIKDKNAKIFKKNIYAYCLEMCLDAENVLGEEGKYLKKLRSAMEDRLKIYEVCGTTGGIR